MAGNRQKSGFDLDDKAFTRSLNRAFEKAKLNTARELRKLALEVEVRATLYSPIDTGNLVHSWYILPAAGTGIDERGIWVDVGNSASYAAAVEFGSRPHEIPNAFGSGRTVMHPGHPTPQPMLRPALLESTQDWHPRVVS